MTKRIDTALAALAASVAARHGHRASEVYACGELLREAGLGPEDVEWVLRSAADLGRRVSFREAFQILMDEAAKEGDDA